MHVTPMARAIMQSSRNVLVRTFGGDRPSTLPAGTSGESGVARDGEAATKYLPEDLPEEWAEFTKINADYFATKKEA